MKSEQKRGRKLQESRELTSLLQTAAAGSCARLTYVAPRPSDCAVVQLYPQRIGRISDDIGMPHRVVPEVCEGGQVCITLALS